MNNYCSKKLSFARWPRAICLLFFLIYGLTGCTKSSELDLQGYVDADYIYIGSAFSGNLQQLNVIRGHRIKIKQALYSLDPEPQYSQLAQAQESLKQAQANLTNAIKGQRQTVISGIQAQITQAEANLALAQIRMEREQKLFATRSVSRDEYDQAITNYKAQASTLSQLKANLAENKLGQRTDVILAQQFAVNAALAQLRQAQWSYQQKNQIAPTDATVFDTYYRVGEFVDAGRPVVSLLAPQNIYFIFFVPASSVSRVALGQTVTITCDSCKQSYTAKIRYISPQVEYTPPVIYSRDNNYKLVFRVHAYPDIKQAPLFHPGQPVYVSIK